MLVTLLLLAASCCSATPSTYLGGTVIEGRLEVPALRAAKELKRGDLLYVSSLARLVDRDGLRLGGMRIFGGAFERVDWSQERKDVMLLAGAMARQELGYPNVMPYLVDLRAPLVNISSEETEAGVREHPRFKKRVRLADAWWAEFEEQFVAPKRYAPYWGSRGKVTRDLFFKYVDQAYEQSVQIVPGRWGIFPLLGALEESPSCEVPAYRVIQGHVQLFACRDYAAGDAIRLSWLDGPLSLEDQIFSRGRLPDAYPFVEVTGEAVGKGLRTPEWLLGAPVQQALQRAQSMQATGAITRALKEARVRVLSGLCDDEEEQQAQGEPTMSFN